MFSKIRLKINNIIGRQANKNILSVAAAMLLCAVILLIASLCLSRDEAAPPVIEGVKEKIVVFEDGDVEAALTDGVRAVPADGESDRQYSVTTHVYGRDGAEITGFFPGIFRLVYACDGAEAETFLIILPEDNEPPVITGAKDITVELGERVSYRDGVTVTDNVDRNVRLSVDAGAVNTAEPGVYTVVYSAEDSRGNRAEVSITVTVLEPEPEETTAEPVEEPGPAEEPTVDPDPSYNSDPDVTQEQLDELAMQILNSITTSEMTQRQKARAIYDYVNRNIRYVGTSDKSGWVTAAYIGFTRGRGDCFNYFACSKELLTLAGIPNIDLVRGAGYHYWQLINVGDGWYHFDACPHLLTHNIDSFMLTETEARAYTEWIKDKIPNYYVYDYDACPVTVVGTPGAELPPETEAPAESKLPEETEPEESGTLPVSDPSDEAERS